MTAAPAPAEPFRRAPAVVLAGLLALVAVLFAFGESRLYYDYAWQLMSVRDYARGLTDSPYVMRGAAHGDLARDFDEWTIGFPLAYNTVGAGLTRLGLPADTAHRAIAAGAIALGLLGWHAVFAATGLPARSRAACVGLLGLSFQGAWMVVFMMPETFLFAFVPWQLYGFVLAVDLDASVRRRLGAALVLGAASGIAYTFRYLAALHSLPLLAGFAAWMLWRRPAGWRPAIVVAATAALVPVAAQSAINYLHIGAINSTSGNTTYDVAVRWPSLNQWLLTLTGPTQAALGGQLPLERAGEWLARRAGIADFEGGRTVVFLLGLPSWFAALWLLIRHAPRDRWLAAGLLGWVGTSAGLLWLFSCSGIPQTDVRYFGGVVMLLLPSVAAAFLRARHGGLFARIALGVLVLPAAIALTFAIYAMGRNLGRAGAAAGQIRPGDTIDPAALKAAVAARLPAPDESVVWMCFQPAVLHALDARHVCEAYLGEVAEWRSSRPLTLVVLRDRQRAMHPSVYARNHVRLDLDSRPPDLLHGSYEVFLCQIGPDGLMRPPR